MPRPRSASQRPALRHGSGAIWLVGYRPEADIPLFRYDLTSPLLSAPPLGDRITWGGSLIPLSMVYLIKAAISRSYVAAWLMLALAPGTPLAADRTALWHIVESCLDSTAENYCATCLAPLEDSDC